MKPRDFHMSFAGLKHASCKYLCKWLKGLTILTVLVGALPSFALQHADLTELQNQVQVFLHEHYRGADAVQVDITVNNLDRRLRLAQCDRPLTMTINDPAYNGGSQTVHTRCEGSAPWAIYVPAQISLFRELPVATRNLERGEIVSSGDISLEVVNTSLVRQGQLADAGSIIGKEVKRPVAKGDPFRVAALDAPLVVKRGDPVEIKLEAGAITVNTMGVALGNGRIGERIRVKNGQSERTISARVIAAGKVSAIL